MKISYNWLKQHISPLPEAGTLDTILTQLGLEVEGITRTGLTEDKLEGLIVGEVMECIPHPNADKLKITKVNIGSGELLSIVCGAPNVATGQKVVVATIGVTLYPTTGEPFKIKKSKIRGEESNGMLCADDEIGLGESHSGIIVLPPETPVGSIVSKNLKVENDALIEIGITPNHADACSHLGIARELRASFQSKGNDVKLEYDFTALPFSPLVSIENPIRVNIMDSNLCPRYAGMYIKGINVEPSPDWLKLKLKSIGLKPINNIVDITNFVLHDIGQPIHAFDADKIKNNTINVRLSAEGEKFITLDGVERKLNATELMICDDEGPLAIAGVFGGIESGVSASTKNIFLESAYFNPAAIRKSARAHGLNTDASFRFERGTDPDMVLWALHYTAKLVTEIAGGSASASVIDNYPEKILPVEIHLRYSHVKQIIGKEIDPEEIKTILKSLNIKIITATSSGMIVSVPPYKNDVLAEIDLCEEIIRVHGLNNVPLPGKISTSIILSGKKQLYAFREAMAQNLCSKGYNEIMNNSLTKASYPQVTPNHRVPLLNPLSGDMAVMRDSLLFTGLETMAYNLNRNNHHLQLFELGKTYSKKNKYEIDTPNYQEWGTGGEVYHEEEHCAIFISGKDEKLSALKTVTAPTFYHLKTILTSVLQDAGINNFTTENFENEFYKYGLSFTVNNKVLAICGAVKNSVLKTFDIQQEVLYADIFMETAYKASPKGFIKVKSISKYPAVRRDLSLLIDDGINFDQLETIARKTERKLLKDVGVFDIYKGDKLGEGKKSYALYFMLQDEEKTLDDKSISTAMQRIQKAMETELGAVVRS
jgi:phenylalanyl-tRNA synthetase beta chain